MKAINKIHLTVINIGLAVLIFLFTTQYSDARLEKNEIYITDKTRYLTNLNHFNITNESVKDLKALAELIKDRKPKAIYLEQWILLEPGNKNLLKKLRKISNKSNIKLYLVIGKNIWFGRRGIENAKSAFNIYGKYFDGLVLRLEPNKSNVWKEDPSIKEQILNLMLDAYSSIYAEAKKRNKLFVTEFPFWFSDFEGPLKTFPQNACDYADKVIFLIDDIEKLEKLELEWNNVACPYNINITKRATKLSEDLVAETLNKLKNKLYFYSNFNGFIIDSDSSLRTN